MTTPISEIIRQRIAQYNESVTEDKDKAGFFANDNISEFIENEEELEALVDEVAGHYEQVLRSMVIDIDNDHNTKGTARRVAKMFIKEIYAGRYSKQPRITEFPNHKNLDSIYTLGPIEVKATCSHHMVPIIGQAWIGIKPTDKVIGISKFHRLSKWVMSRPHIQEESVEILADELERIIKPEGLAIVVKATHMCMTMRGVEAPHDSSMVTSVVRGSMRKSESQKQEFFNIIESQGFKR